MYPAAACPHGNRHRKYTKSCHPLHFYCKQNGRRNHSFIIEAKDAKNTKKSTKNAFKCFRDFLDESNEDVQFENM